MNFYPATAFLTTISAAGVGTLVLLRNPHGQVNKRWFILSLSVAFWSTFLGLMFLEESPEAALRFSQLLQIGASLIPITYFHFVLALLALEFKQRIQTLLRLGYAITLLLLALGFTPLLVKGVVYSPLVDSFYPVAGPAYILYICLFFFLPCYAWLLMAKSLARVTGLKRNQTKYVMAASAIGFLGGSSTFPLWFGMPVSPWGSHIVFLYTTIISIAIIRYRLMDIKLAITRTAVFSLVYALVLGLPLIGALLWQQKLERVLGATWWVWLWVVCALLATAAHYANLYFQSKAEERLLKAQRRYQATLLQASHGMTQIRDLKRLLDMIVHVITKAVGVTHAAAYLEDPKENAYLLRAYRYKNKLGSIDRLSKDDPLLVRWLKDEEEPVVLEELKAKFSDTAAGNGHDNAQTDLLSQLNGLNASVVVPSFMQNELIGFLVLGPKRDGRIFTTEDLNVFSTLANQAALAIENARFFDELKMNEVFMIQSEKMASLGQLASGMAHEIHNPLAIISGESQLYLEQARGKDPQIDTLLQSIIDECFRAADITRRILRFAKPGKSEFQAVDMKAVVEECLQLVGYQVRLERFQRTVNVPADLPKVKGNQNQLQEVILNLVLNACQAMGEQGGKIEIAAEPDGDEVEIRVADNGPGIPKSKLSKVFDPFYTTKATGTGLGLFVSHRIVRAHNGTIRVDSTEGQGTEFIIRLPVFRETEAAAAR